MKHRQFKRLTTKMIVRLSII